MLTENELNEIEARVKRATPGPWKAYIEGRDHTSGSNFVMTSGEDIELSGATEADFDFVAHAREDLPRLIEEVRRLKMQARIETRKSVPTG